MAAGGGGAGGAAEPPGGELSLELGYLFEMLRVAPASAPAERSAQATNLLRVLRRLPEVRARARSRSACSDC